MSDQDALTPRVFLVRHGETSWAKLGRFTGTTEIELTQTGIAQVSLMAETFVGAGKLMDPSHLSHVFVSPRTRAVQTFQLLLPCSTNVDAGKVVYTEDIAEWNYGDYEGLTDPEIRDLRKRRGLDLERDWDIWTDGCKGGESAQQVGERLDRLILQIKEIQKPYMHGEKSANVLLVAHGLILRCFVKRWLGWMIHSSLPMTLLPGSISVLSYKANDITQPALHVGTALPLPN
ncbi:putative phosphoglycerate mutase [Plenodomus tracheiphilus IPT5]|uniref:Phosphoglycerate mutase n=1 Tax=Plenodomus tracheiphilus IPT5 TaxID=1408161 RepID=A0A6A7B1N4_9PLEO|nr:putative phosphoglycerate mutase [Plenodomus tracheiphilus IPT5]